MRDEIKACLITSLESMLDPYMAGHGFARRAKSLVYKRKYKGSLQSIDMVIQIHPKDNLNAAAAIYPNMEVHAPAVDQVLQDMIGDNRSLLLGITKGLSSQPIDFIAQKAEKGRWYVYQPDSVPEIVLGVRSFMDRLTIPFLDVYATPEDIVAVDEHKDSRMVVDPAQIMRVVAAALVCNRKTYAQAVMEKRLGTLGARQRYQQVYDYIEQVN